MLLDTESVSSENTDSIFSMLKEMAFSDDSPSVYPVESYATCNIVLHFFYPLCPSLFPKMSQKLNNGIFLS